MTNTTQQTPQSASPSSLPTVETNAPQPTATVLTPQQALILSLKPTPQRYW